MLEGYFDYDKLTDEQSYEKRKRLMAVQAALEIAKQAAQAEGGVYLSLVNTTQYLNECADAIQKALD